MPQILSSGHLTFEAYLPQVFKGKGKGLSLSKGLMVYVCSHDLTPDLTCTIVIYHPSCRGSITPPGATFGSYGGKQGVSNHVAIVVSHRYQFRCWVNKWPVPRQNSNHNPMITVLVTLQTARKLVNQCKMMDSYNRIFSGDIHSACFFAATIYYFLIKVLYILLRACVAVIVHSTLSVLLLISRCIGCIIELMQEVVSFL